MTENQILLQAGRMFPMVTEDMFNPEFREYDEYVDSQNELRDAFVQGAKFVLKALENLPEKKE